jgi:PAS domain S-box-containing protein
LSEVDTKKNATAPRAPTREPDLSSPFVLLVDDQPARLLTYESILEGVGVQCVRATSGTEALDKLLKQSFAVILLDVMMPGIDGFETANLIRQHPRFEHTPIIFVTGAEVSAIDQLKGYEVGAIDYISVPLVPEILRSKVALLVELYKRRAELERLNRELEAKRDVERRFRAESAERDWLAAVLSSMTEEVYFTDPQQRYTYANPAAMREFGRDTISGMGVADVLAELNVLRADGSPRPLKDAPPLRALRGEVIRDEEHIVRTPRSGAMRHRQVSSAPVRDTSNAIIGSVTVVRDITDRKQFEAALAADLRDTRLLRELGAQRVGEDPRELYEAILGAAITISKADGGTIQLLDEATRALHFAAIRGIEQALWSQFESVDASSGSPCGLALASGTRSFTIFDDPSLPDPDGSLRKHFEFGFRSAQSTPLISRAGRVLGMFSTHWKTRRELSERELHFLDLLARQAADLIERTQGETELRRREQELRESDRRKDEFIAVLAHELRNPLVPIRNGIELLKNAQARPALIDTVRPMMERQIGHMVRLIDDLLDVARISAGKIDLKHDRVELSGIIASAIEATRPAFDAAHLELSLDVAEPDVRLDVDATRISQVISNILQNASKFTPPGGKVKLSTGSGNLGDAPALVISIADTGVGIDAAQLPRVFDLFAQSGTRMRGHQGGLGIGLAIARRLVEMHGGTLVARSEGANRGSEFIITLPTLRQAPDEPDAPLEAQDSIQGTRVLIVDDNQDAADSMALLVELGGALVRVAYSAEQGLDLIAESPPDVVLLDIGMPGLNGYEACRRIRAKYGHRITLIAVSGWGQDADKQLALDTGFDAHLTKPADPETLERTIAQLARRR